MQTAPSLLLIDGDTASRPHALKSRGYAPAEVGGVRQVPTLGTDAIDWLVPNSAVMGPILAEIQRRAGTEIMLAIEGPKGAAHAALARRFHRFGARAEGPFVVVPARANPKEVEAALFGGPQVHSAFALAKGGIVFIESIASLGPNGQERLLKLLHGLIASKKAGSTVRWPPMVFAVEPSLKAEVEAGRVRADLAELLTPTSITIPPLAAWGPDLPSLVERIATAQAGAVGAARIEIEPGVVELLRGRALPDNLGELLAEVQRISRVENDRLIVDRRLAAMPPPAPVSPAPRVVPAPAPAPMPVSEPAASETWAPALDAQGQVQSYEAYEAQIFRFALRHSGGCVSRAAELLGVGRATMYRKMRAYDIEVPPVSERSVSRAKKARAGNEQGGDGPG